MAAGRLALLLAPGIALGVGLSPASVTRYNPADGRPGPAGPRGRSPQDDLLAELNDPRLTTERTIKVLLAAGAHTDDPRVVRALLDWWWFIAPKRLMPQPEGRSLSSLLTGDLDQYNPIYDDPAYIALVKGRHAALATLVDEYIRDSLAARDDPSLERRRRRGTAGMVLRYDLETARAAIRHALR